MITYVLNVFRIRWFRSRRIIAFSITVIVFVWNKLKSRKIHIPFTFIRANTIKKVKQITGEIQKITIVCVVTKKDFLTLPKVLLSAVKAVGQENLEGIRIVVPDSHRLELQSLLKNLSPVKMNISTDEDLITAEQFDLIKNHFDAKASWVIQQFLKFESVRVTPSNCLILDSDTYILNDKYLRVVDGLQPLTPSEEYHLPYYNFLARISPLYNQLEFSFIPHHLIVQRDVFDEMCKFLRINTLQDLIQICIKHADVKEISPLCVDFELYAQYLFKKHPHRFFLVKWSNISIANGKFSSYTSSIFLMFVLKKLFNSVSFHSWS